MFALIFNPGTDEEERFAFTVSEGDVQEALECQRARKIDPINKQLSSGAFHKVMELRVCPDRERLYREAWIIYRNDRPIGLNDAALNYFRDHHLP